MKTIEEISNQIEALHKIHSEKFILARSLDSKDSDILIQEMKDLCSKIHALNWVLSES